MKKFILLSLFIATSTYAQVGVGNLKEKSMYDIGTGFSVSYFNQYTTVSIESIHLLRNVARPFDNAFLKIGMGAKINVKGNTDLVGFNFSTSVGYLYIQDQYHEKSVLRRFGTGVTLDYTLVGSTVENEASLNSMGFTLYILANSFIVGLGGGVIIEEMIPYVNTSLAITF